MRRVQVIREGKAEALVLASSGQACGHPSGNAGAGPHPATPPSPPPIMPPLTSPVTAVLSPPATLALIFSHPAKRRPLR